MAGPGTGKTFLFKKVLNGKTKTLTLSFVNSLVDDLSLELYGISEVRTLHSFGRSELSKILKKEVNIYSKLPAIIREDFQILTGGDIEFDVLFHERDDSNPNLAFYEARRNYYNYYGFADVIHAAVKAFEADNNNVPSYEQVLIDEFQDFNKLEVSLIDLLAEKSPILLAGDDDQALYEFLKNASAHHIRLRHRDEMPEYASYNLPFCARCPEVVVEATNDLINAANYDGTDRKKSINQITDYSTVTLGVGAYFRWKPFEKQNNFLKGIFTSTSVRYWQNVYSSLDNNEYKYFHTVTNKNETLKVSNIGIANTPFIFNIALGYSIMF